MPELKRVEPLAASGGVTSSDRVYRVAFVNTHPIQYFAPLYAYLTRHCRINVTALYLSDFSLSGGLDRGFARAVSWDVDLLDGYTAKFMGEAASRRRIGGFFSMVAPELWHAIRSGNFDAVVIHGHNLAAHHVALAAAKSTGSLAFARGETHLGLKREAWRDMVRKPALRAWYKAFDAFLAIGTANAQYYAAMGVPEADIFLVPYTVDNARFSSAAAAAVGNRIAVRNRLGLAGPAPAILFAAKFDHRKRPDDLLRAFCALQREGLEAHLVMVGSGAMEPDLRAMVANLGLRNVVFPGFVNQAELPSVYAACDVFVLPSGNEPWGLAVNEAMCAGLPIVLSEEIGCAADLVESGINGARFGAGDISDLAAALKPILLDASLRARYRAASLDRIQGWSFAQCGAGLRDAIETVSLRRSGHNKPVLPTKGVPSS